MVNRKRFGTELNPSGFATQSLIGIKRNKITHSQILNSIYPSISLSSPQMWTQINKMEETK
jgi:hypothetical protein